jgi:hypothetical protein
MTEPDPLAGRCHAHSKQTGKPCRQPAIAGGAVCRFHGGAAPQVKQKALDRLMALQHPAIDRLASLVAQTEFPSTAYQAVRDVLDRTMGKPAESLALTGAEGKPLEIIVRVPWRDAQKD